MSYLTDLQLIGLTLIRIGFGIIFLIFGYNKLISGSIYLAELGSAMGLFGITWGYILWGYLAALTEIMGGLSFISGFYTRIATVPLAWLLIVAIRFHLEKNDPFSKWAFACLCLCVVIAFFISGSGIYSFDHMIKNRLSHKATLHNNQLR